MTRDDIIRMARESGVESYGPTNMCPSKYDPFVDCLERFAIAIERESYRAGQERMLERAKQCCIDLHGQWKWGDEPDSNSGPRECADAISNLEIEEPK